MSERNIRNLHELPRELPPARDLWPGVSAALGAAGAPRRRAPRYAMAAAAAVSMLVVGLWIGRATAPPSLAPVAQQPGTSVTMSAAFAPNEKYQAERARLLALLQQRLQALPPEARAKVLASLEATRQSIADIKAALGEDPGNLLLQGLLVDSYQDEMRVLATTASALEQET